jgi:O-antigen/teichoic acid export membrane protein
MKSKLPSIKINFIYTLTYQVLAIIVPLITTPYISRILAPESIGIISYTTSICNYFILFGNLGMAIYAQLEIARHRENKHDITCLFVEISIARTSTILLSLIVYMVFVSVTGQYRRMYIVLSTNIIGAMLDCSWFYQGIEDFKKVMLRNFVVKISCVILIFTLVKKPEDLYLYVAILYGSTIIANAYLWIGIRKNLIKVKWKDLQILRHYKGCIIYFVPMIATVLSASVGKTLLGYIGKSNAENGYFEQAYKIQNVIIQIPTALNWVMRPRMAYLVQNNRKEELSEKMIRSVRFILFLMTGISFILVGTADNIIPWFFGEGWEKVSILIKLLSICILFNSITLCFSEQYFLPYKKISTITAILYTGTAINILVNILLIPILQSVGSTLAIVASEAVVMMLSMFFSRKDVKVLNIAKISIKYIIAGGSMLIILYAMSSYVPATIYGFMLLMLTGTACYLTVLLLLRDELSYEIIHLVKNYCFKFVRKITKKSS